jgi:hypothetical protein
MSSFRHAFALPMLLCAVVACSATPPTEARAPAAEMSGDRPTAAAPPPGASGKLSPEMVGKVSPVPAFMGQGGRGAKRWSIDIRSEGEMRHRVKFIWTEQHKRWEGEVFYSDEPGPSQGAPIVLEGTLDTAKGKRSIRIGIITERCTDHTGATHPQKVTIALQDAAELNGCGELAVY